MIQLDTAPRTVLILLCLIPFIAVEESAAQSRDRNPLEAGNELDGIQRLPDSVIRIGVPQSWFDFKDDVYEKIGLKFGFSYQLLYQSASEVLPDATYDTAAGDWWGFLTKWTLLNRGKDYEGTFVFSMFRSCGRSATTRCPRTSESWTWEASRRMPSSRPGVLRSRTSTGSRISIPASTRSCCGWAIRS